MTNDIHYFSVILNSVKNLLNISGDTYIAQIKLTRQFECCDQREQCIENLWKFRALHYFSIQFFVPQNHSKWRVFYRWASPKPQIRNIVFINNGFLPAQEWQLILTSSSSLLLLSVFNTPSLCFGTRTDDFNYVLVFALVFVLVTNHIM